MSKRGCYVVLLAVLILIVGSITNKIFQGGPDAPSLGIKSALSPDKTIQDVSCNNGYIWRVTETDKVDPGNEFELGKPARIYQVKLLQLIFSGQIIATTDGLENTNDIPAGEAFTHAFLFVPPTTLFSDRITTGMRIGIPSSKISVQGFDTVAQCLAVNRIKIGTALHMNTGPAVVPIGSLIRIDDGIARDSYFHGPEFVCGDGQHATTNGVYLDFLPVGKTWKNGWKSAGMIGLDGKLYPANASIELPVDTSHEIKLPNALCKNSEGVTLQDYIASIPSRITFLFYISSKDEYQ